MELAEKAKMLEYLDTLSLITKMHQYEDALEKAMINQADFKNNNHQYLASSGDCGEVKRILAELAVLTPEADGNGKKMTVPDKEKWLLRQRKENKELSDTIVKQREVAFLIDDYQIRVEMAKKRLEGLKGVLALKTAQINFLASG